MTERQIKWAAQHDWYVATLASGEGVLVWDAYVTRDGVLHQDSVAFVDFRKLRRWAGY
jgi:hypothetical protein